MAIAHVEDSSARWRSTWWVLLLALSVALGTAVLSNGSGLVQAVREDWPELLFWSGLVGVVNLVPLRVGRLLLTLDTPVVLATAFLYDPAVATLVALVATLDRREFARAVPLSIALFNRLQTGAAVLLAGWTFHFVGGLNASIPVLVTGTLAALAVDYLVNVMFIVTYQVLQGVGFRRAIGNLQIGDRARFLGLYLGYGALAVVLALLFRQVAAWATVALLVPILVARQSLMRAQELEALTGRLQNRERLMEQLLDRMVDERKDERLRIASDLHDNVLQSLIRIWLLSQILKKSTGERPANPRDVDDLFMLADESIHSLRSLMRESPLGRGGLLPTLEGLVRDLRLDWGARIEFHAPSQLDLPPTDQVALYQVAREALMNAIKHANASRIRVRLEQGPPAAVEVEDDGIGFNPKAVDESTHFGLGLMRERVRHIGGQLQVCSTPGRGTLIRTYLSQPEGAPAASSDLLV
jgi:signal transduction histidine kinase